MAKRLLRQSEVTARVRYGATALRELVKAGKFPAPGRLGDGPTSPRVWDEDEVDGWIQKRLDESRAA